MFAQERARNADALQRLRLFSWHCPLSSALASAIALASPMPFSATPQERIYSCTRQLKKLKKKKCGYRYTLLFRLLASRSVAESTEPDLS